MVDEVENVFGNGDEAVQEIGILLAQRRPAERVRSEITSGGGEEGNERVDALLTHAPVVLEHVLVVARVVPLEVELEAVAVAEREHGAQLLVGHLAFLEKPAALAPVDNESRAGRHAAVEELALNGLHVAQRLLAHLVLADDEERVVDDTIAAAAVVAIGEHFGESVRERAQVAAYLLDARRVDDERLIAACHLHNNKIIEIKEA